MKLVVVVSALILIVLSASTASAQCQHSTDACVTSISLSASAIPGDQFTETVATGQIHIPQGLGSTLIALELQIDASLDVTSKICGSGTDPYAPEPGYSIACGARNLSGDVSISVSLAGLNGGPGIQTGLVHAIVLYFSSENKPTAPLEIDPVTAYTETPDKDPDGPCPTCGYGGPPINFTNGNTYFTQQDYSIPGLAGGLTLARTWNSMWSRKQPPETVGLFGDSWRSNFEERVQVTGNTAKYWKGNGSLPSTGKAMAASSFTTGMAATTCSPLQPTTPPS